MTCTLVYLLDLLPDLFSLLFLLWSFSNFLHLSIRVGCLDWICCLLVVHLLLKLLDNTRPGFIHGQTVNNSSGKRLCVARGVCSLTSLAFPFPVVALTS